MRGLLIFRPTYKQDGSVAASPMLTAECVEVTSSSSTLHLVTIPSSADLSRDQRGKHQHAQSVKSTSQAPYTI